MTRASTPVTLSDRQSTVVGSAFLSLVPTIAATALAGLLVGILVWLVCVVIAYRQLRPRVIVTVDGRSWEINPLRSSLEEQTCRPTSTPPT